MAHRRSFEPFDDEKNSNGNLREQRAQTRKTTLKRIWLRLCTFDMILKPQMVESVPETVADQTRE